MDKVIKSTVDKDLHGKIIGIKEDFTWWYSINLYRIGHLASVLHNTRLRDKLKCENAAHLPRKKKKEIDSGRTLPPFV